jgi:hypothetical protein
VSDLTTADEITLQQSERKTYSQWEPPWDALKNHYGEEWQRAQDSLVVRQATPEERIKYGIKSPSDVQPEEVKQQEQPLPQSVQEEQPPLEVVSIQIVDDEQPLQKVENVQPVDEQPTQFEEERGDTENVETPILTKKTYLQLRKDGVTKADIARMCGVTIKKVRYWAGKWEAEEKATNGESPQTIGKMPSAGSTSTYSVADTSDDTTLPTDDVKLNKKPSRESAKQLVHAITSHDNEQANVDHTTPSNDAIIAEKEHLEFVTIRVPISKSAEVPKVINTADKLRGELLNMGAMLIQSAVALTYADMTTSLGEKASVDLLREYVEQNLASVTGGAI